MLFSDQPIRNFVDAIMLFGACMEPRKERVVIRLNRSIERRRSLAWLVATLLQHGIDIKLCDTANDDVIVYRTEGMMFMRREYERWYDALGKHMPADVHVTTPLLVVWSVEALSGSSSKTADDKVWYHLPAFHDPLVLDRMVRDAAGLGFQLRLNADGVFFQGREELGLLVSDYAPRAAWDVEMAVEV